ncbi:MAG: helix-turn-helix domain-containing protein [Phycisphaerae bacterium]|nr:helix-turn-helix domain-containing protein [Phycisphaerae bacterium]
MIPSLLSPVETANLLAERLKNLRLQAGYKRTTLAKRAGVSESSLKRFEATGQISLKNLLRLAYALGRLVEFDKLLVLPEAASLSELKSRDKSPIPKRGKI